MVSPTAEALTLDTTAKTVLTGSTINSNVTVGVKAGDWMEYNVTYVGAADPPEDYPNWFRFQINDVQGTSITAAMTYEALNGTISRNSNIYDLKTGVLQLLVVPAGLTYADVFYHEDYGNITIIDTETGTYAGQTRTAAYAIFNEKKVKAYWDKVTGILLQSEQQVLNADNQTVAQKVTLSATNLWHDPNAPDNLELDEIVFYAKIVVVIVIVAIIVILLIRLRKRKK
jgi:hypothetical protein